MDFKLVLFSYFTVLFLTNEPNANLLVRSACSLVLARRLVAVEVGDVVLAIGAFITGWTRAFVALGHCRVFGASSAVAAVAGIRRARVGAVNLNVTDHDELLAVRPSSDVADADLVRFVRQIIDQADFDSIPEHAFVVDNLLQKLGVARRSVDAVNVEILGAIRHRVSGGIVRTREEADGTSHLCFLESVADGLRHAFFTVPRFRRAGKCLDSGGVLDDFG